MPIPDPDELWPKLEKAGVDEVRKRLAMGVYAHYKIPVIEEWLRRKEVEAKEKENAPTCMYHEQEAPSGEVFPASKVPELERKGWVDSPAKFGKGFRGRSRRVIRTLLNFWLQHWKWIITTALAALGIWIVYIKAGK